MKSIKEFADAYRAIGWTVLPAPLGKKYPAMAWKEFQSRRPTDEEHTSWFNAPCNIVVITGILSDVMVVDLDSYKEKYQEIDIDSPVKSHTPSGGTHLFFKYNSAYGNKVVSSLAIDIRSEGGLIVLPPSVYEGNTYSWYDEAADFAHLPVFNHEGLHESIQAINDKPFDIKDNLQIEIGARNDSLFKTACHLIRVHKDNETAWYFTKLAGWDYTPPMLLTDMRTLFKSAVKSVKADVPTDYTIGAVRPQKKVVSSKEALIEADKIQTKIDKIPPIGIPEIDTMIKFIPGELYLISAETHAGKTLLATQLASMMALNNNKKVLYISLESGFLILHIVKGICNGVVPEHMYWYFPTDIITMKEIEEAIEEMDFDCIYIDHLHFTKMEQNKTMGETINEMVLQLQLLARRKSIPIVALCHLRKSQQSKDGNMPTLSDLKDTSALAQVPAVVILIYREKSEREKEGYLSQFGRVIIAKNRFGNTGSIPFVLKDKRFIFGKEDNTIHLSKKPVSMQVDEITKDYPML